MAWYGVVWRHVVRCYMMGLMLCEVGAIWGGIVWCSVQWCGVQWCGVFGMVWSVWRRVASCGACGACGACGMDPGAYLDMVLDLLTEHV